MRGSSNESTLNNNKFNIADISGHQPNLLDLIKERNPSRDRSYLHTHDIDGAQSRYYRIKDKLKGRWNLNLETKDITEGRWKSRRMVNPLNPNYPLLGQTAYRMRVEAEAVKRGKGVVRDVNKNSSHILIEEGKRSSRPLQLKGSDPLLNLESRRLSNIEGPTPTGLFVGGNIDLQNND